MKRVSIRKAIIEAIERTDDSLIRHMNMVTNWAKYIEREIGSVNGYKYKNKAFTISGCTLQEPSDCYRPVKVVLGNYEDVCNLRYKGDCFPVIQEDVNPGADVYGRDLTYYWIPLEAKHISDELWEEVGDEINFPTNYDNQEITLVYQYIETDEKNDWIVNESHIPAIRDYIVYRASEKFRWMWLRDNKLTRANNATIIEQYKQEYNISVRHARAEDDKENPLMRRVF